MPANARRVLASDRIGGHGPSTSPYEVTERMVSTVMTGSTDALEVLFDSTQAAPRHVEADDQSNAHNTQAVLREARIVQNVIYSLSEPSEELLDLWDRCRFTRLGWFTAQEAITYIDLFFQYLAPMSTVSLEQFRSHENHSELIYEEPFLCCVLLMLASRIFVLPGVGGWSRSHNIHYRLWRYCEHLLLRVLLGQKKRSSAKIRTLGTIEALILIIEWPPRAVNFPPESEGWDGALIPVALTQEKLHRRQRRQQESLVRWREDVFDPTKRTDHMGWMLLGMAINLGLELGLFSNSDGLTSTASALSTRESRLLKLIYLSATQASVRLRLPSPLPASNSRTFQGTSSNTAASAQTTWNVFLDMSTELLQLSKASAAMFFGPLDRTKSTPAVNAQYLILLDHFATSMSKWYASYTEKSEALLRDMRTLLLIDYHHLRACTGAVAIQAVVERARNIGQTPSAHQDLANWSIYVSSEDAKHIKDVLFHSQEVLRVSCLTNFKERIPYTPLRIRFAVISSSIFILKALGIGIADIDKQAAFDILDQGMQVLRTFAPDDMCFASRSATLIMEHTARLHAKLSPSRRGRVNGSGKSSEESDAPAPVPANTVLPGQDNNNNTGLGHANNDPFDTGTLPGTAGGDMDPYASTDWFGLQFDQGLAPFGDGTEQLSLGLEVDSLDFLWSLDYSGAYHGGP